MSRLASLAFSCLFLLAGTLASACPTCGLPAASAPITDPPAQAVFEAAAPGALLHEERAWLLALEGGRLESVGGRLADREAASPETHLLTNAAAWTLLGRRATERTAELRARAKDGRLPEELRGEAVALFWLRGTLVSPQDRDFLRAATEPKGKPEPGAGTLENGPRDPGGAGIAGAEAQSAAIVRDLRARLDIAPGDDPRAAAAMDEALENLVKSPTGRELALEFIATGARAKVIFGEVPDSGTVVQNGRRVLQASGGNTQTWENPPLVTLNKDYLDTDPDYRRVATASTLGHELFGHAFEIQRAKKAGIPSDAVYYYRGDEAGSGLVGWLVQAELGGALSNGHMWNYLADPEVYHAGLKTNLPYYSTTLSLAEMRAPVATLESRVAKIARDRISSREHAATMVAWRGPIKHFIEIHAVEEASFSSLNEDIAAAVVWNNTRQKTLDDIGTYLRGKITTWKMPQSDALKKELLSASTSPYMRESEERLSARAERLRRLVAGRVPEPMVPPVPGKLTWEEFHRMLDRDRKDMPEHWENKK